ncbi:RidA family protein [Enterobacter quasihormaechei]|uniref:RidA family protein n=1 Tax=Enterobacter quasihormaechei TaxID=2529382 RepID=A0ABU9PM57_9ENTR
MKRYKTSIPYAFSRATEANGFLFLSGQLPLNARGEPVYTSIEDQTRLVMQNISDTLLYCGSSIERVVKATVWISDMSHFDDFNKVYSSFFKNGFPSRSTVVSKLAFGLDIEIEVQALA